MPEKFHILFIINPISGGNDKEDFIQDLKKYSQDYCFSYETFFTSGDNDLEKLKNAISVTQADRVAAVGGDGTSSLVGQAIKGSDVPMGIIPFGSANGMAAELGLPTRPARAIHNLINGKTVAIDLLLFNDKHYAMRMGDLGFNAHIVRGFEESDKRGLGAYFKQFLKELRISPRRTYYLKINGHKIKRKAVMVAIANATRYGIGTVLNPKGKLNDGRLEVCIIKSIHFNAMLRLLWGQLTGNMYRSEHAEIITCSELTVSMKNAHTLQVDGEIIGKEQVIRAKVIPACVKLLVPANPYPETLLA